MRIGFDLHGVLEKHPTDFKALMNYLIRMGHEIWIVSGPTVDTIIKELSDLGIKKDKHYQNVISIVDFLSSNGTAMWMDKDNHWWSDDESWWSSKYKMCKFYNIHILIDDSFRYGEYFDSSLIFLHLTDDNFHQIKDKIVFLSNN